MMARARDPQTRRAVAWLRALSRVPEDVRRFALARVAFASLGDRDAMALCIPAVCFRNADALIAVTDVPDIEDVIAHELGHAWHHHVTGSNVEPSAESERQAAGFARAWGFSGRPADPDACASSFTGNRVPIYTLSTRVDDDVLSAICARCGGTMSAAAPTVPGAPAGQIGFACDPCGLAAVVGLADLLRCDSCGRPVACSWAPGSTPQVPRAVWTCSCGWTATRTFAVDAIPGPKPSPAQALMREAWRLCALAEETARRVSSDDADGIVMATAGLPSSIALAMRSARRARALDPDGLHVAMCDSALVRLGEAAHAVAAGALGPAADCLAAAARDLDSTSVGALR